MAKKKRQPEPVPSSINPDEQPSTPAAPGKKTQPTWRSGLDFIAMLGGAIVVALLIKAYVADVYIIPSGSMETALNGRPDGGDRIFCSKLSYHYREPQRWEVAVFTFPYEVARRNDRKGLISAEMRNQNFVKRIVGMPGETMAIGRGDIWVAADSRTGYQRLVKPDSVQRGMWLKVYYENFADLDITELRRFWKIMGDGASLEKGGPLVLRPDANGMRLDYRPMAPVGATRDRMVEMAGIPDRYVLKQPVQFRCKGQLSDGTECGHLFVKTVETHNVQGRCPRCGHLADETEVEFYHRRSGLPMVGRFAVGANSSRQGEGTILRQDDYHIVPDLRVETDFVLAEAGSTFAVSLREDARFVQVVASAGGTLDLRINGSDPRPEHRKIVSGLRPGGKHHLECYVIDGQARVFLDYASEPVLDEAVWGDDKRPYPQDNPRVSGISIAASGGEVRLENIAIDRDIFYYSGKEFDRNDDYYGAMNIHGEVTVGPESFFPMGDHCASSFDARSWGPVPLDMLKGPALLIWWPPSRMRMIPAP